MGFLNRNKNEVAAAAGVNSQEELCPENVMEEMTETEITAESAPESSPVTLPDELPEQEAPKSEAAAGKPTESGTEVVAQSALPGNRPAEAQVLAAESVVSGGFPLSAIPGKPAEASAVTVYAPYQPDGPTVTALEIIAKEAKTALRKQRRRDRRRLRGWRKDARKKAAAFRGELRDAEGREEKIVLRKRYRTEKRAWKKSIKNIDESERRLQKKAFAAFRKRYRLRQRILAWVLLLVILGGAVWKTAPVLENAGKAVGIRYTLTGETAEAARLAGRETAERISDEGIVLLENKNGFLPLQNRKMNVFGADAYGIEGGSGESAELFLGLEAAGIAYNTSLHRAYINAGAGKRETRLAEVLPAKLRSGFTGLLTAGSETGIGKSAGAGLSGTDGLTDEATEAAREFSDQCLVVIGEDCSAGEDRDAENGLSLSVGDRALLRKADETFEHVIIVINSAGMRELDFIDGLKHVEAVLWIGQPGEMGCASLGKLLTGEVNPSGRLPDTWARESRSFPSSVNFTKDSNRFRYSETDKNYSRFEEGIYVGYRYFETAYEKDASGYEKAVRYPFGYGLGYTEFAWETEEFRVNGGTADSAGGGTGADAEIVWKVRVSNEGELAGKDVLQLYYAAPYTEGGPEKAASALGDYAKTSLLMPGESETVTLRLPVSGMASYDMSAGSYILDAGEYILRLCRNSHEVVEEQIYEALEKTETAEGYAPAKSGTKNRFDFADGGITVFSRGNMTGTYPRGTASEPGSGELRTRIREYNSPEPLAGREFTTGANNGIMLSDMKGLAYDDPKWEAFLDQFTADELFGLFSRAGWETEEIRRLGIPSVKTLGEYASLRSAFTEMESVVYPSAVTMASTWNRELAEEFGEAVGREAAAYGIGIWYGPELSLHRSPYGGKNAMTYSEDPLLTGTLAAETVKGAAGKGVTAVLRGFVADSNVSLKNDGMYTWIDEQTLRELYLRPFEIAVKDGGAQGIMTSVTHLGHKWCGACSELLNDVLRDEWGFEGFVTTETVRYSYMDSALAVRNGTSLMRETGLAESERNLKRAYREDPQGILNGLREAARDFCYVLVGRTG